MSVNHSSLRYPGKPTGEASFVGEVGEAHLEVLTRVGGAEGSESL